MVSCCQPSSQLCLFSIFMEHLGSSSTSLSLMSFGKSWWNKLQSLEKARKKIGASCSYFCLRLCLLLRNQSNNFCANLYLINRYGKLEELLEKSFPLVKMPSIQPVVMQVLKHLPKASPFKTVDLLHHISCSVRYNSVLQDSVQYHLSNMNERELLHGQNKKVLHWVLLELE